jgi:ribosomal protein L11 methyltransferase
MAWQSLKIAVDAHTADILGDALMELGALSIGIEDAHAGTEREQAIFGEPGEPPAGMWQESVLSAMFDKEVDVERVLREAVDAGHLKTIPPHVVEAVPEQDWVRQTQAQFDPIKISDRLWIVPTWHSAPDPYAVNLVLDPGLAFGTGSHPTTRLCLQWLDRNILGGESVLDYGCGSGILAIAAMKLGARRAVGVDIDPQAIQASLANAAQNGVAAEFFLPDAAPRMEADIVVTNILANPLKVLAPMLAHTIRPGGLIALSGILAEQAQDVMATYREWFDLGVAGEAEGWVCLAGTRRWP